MDKRARTATPRAVTPRGRPPRDGAALGAGALFLAALLAVVAVRLWRPALGTPAQTSPAAESGLSLEEARLRDGAARGPRDAGARQDLGRFFLDQGRPFEAIWELGAARDLNPSDPAITLQLAVALASASLYGAAIDQLEPLVARTPPSREGRVQLATLYVAKGEPGKAAALLLAAPEGASWAEGQLALGRARQAAGETDRAVAAYRRALDLAPAADEPRLRLAGLYRRLDQVKEARKLLEGAPADAPPSPRRLTLLAETFLGDGAHANPRSAARWLAAALESDPAHVPALVALGGLHRREGRLKDATRAYAEALRLAPGDAAANAAAADLLVATGRRADAHAVRARAFRARGLPSRAIREYEALARFPSHDRDAILEMSLLLVQTQQKPRAERLVEAALERYPLDTALYERLVVLQLIVRKHDAARRRCAEWQRLEPKSHRPSWLLAQIAADQSDFAGARRLLEPVVAAEPENTDYAATLADIMLKEAPTELPKARALSDYALTNPATEPKTHLQLAEVLQRMGDLEGARSQALRALDRDPDLSEPYGLLLQLARRIGEPEQLQFWVPVVRAAEERIRTRLLLSRRVWAHPEDPVAHRDLALHLVDTAELRKAESHLEEALRLRPGWEEVTQLLERVRRTREAL